MADHLPVDSNEDDAPPDLTRPAAALVLLAGLLHVVLGGAALLGTPALEANVKQIESNPDYGHLYFSLAVWGAIVLVLGFGELAAAAAAMRRTEAGWLSAMLLAFLGLTISFFSMAIFRVGALVAIVLLFMACFLLAYHSRRIARWP
ncbi:MAG: hypothetical protein QOG62_2324 [Thermoleophilaceae bacterium]|nr:hypothetical protein [Thermoleophilaceae bacterium]